MKKLSKINESFTNRNKYFIPIISMIIYICVALGITLGIKAVFGNQNKEENVLISNNSAEEFYFNGKYDAALKEFTSLQEKEIWPLHMVNVAKIQLISGEYVQSNKSLQKAYEIRNKVIDTKKSEIENIQEKDIDLGNQIIFTYFLNGEYKKAAEYGEFYLNIYPENHKLKQTMFTVFLSNNELDKAKEIVENYDFDDTDSNDLVAIAQMNFVIGNYDEGLKFLDEAFNIDKDLLKIFDAIAQVKSQSELLDKVIKLQEKNKESVFYKAVLAKIYSMDENNKEKALQLIEELDDQNVESANLDLLKYNILKDDSNENILDILKDKYDETTFMGLYIRAIESYNNNKYDDAFKYAKKCIAYDKNYNGVYYFIQEIKTAQKKAQMAEPFIINAMYNETYNYNIIVKTAEYYKNIIKDSNKAVHYYELATLINQKDGDIFYNIGLIQLNNQRVDEAVEYIKKSISINGNCAKYYRTLGCIYLEKKEKEKSIDYIRKAYNLDEKNILTLNDAAYYYAVIDNNIDRAMVNIKYAFDGISDKTKEENKKIVTDNYNRIKIAFDSSKKENSSKTKVSELKLIY